MTIHAMIVRYTGIALTAIAISAGAGCGIFYQAGREARTIHMRGALKAGETPLQVHNDWGEPEMRSSASEAEIWSYAERANTNDIAATLFYTSAKPGDEGKFLDLKFVGGKLVSWNETKHTLPAKEGGGSAMDSGPATDSGRVVDQYRPSLTTKLVAACETT